MTFIRRSGTMTFSGSDVGQLLVRRRWLGRYLYHASSQLGRLSGIRRSDAYSLNRALRKWSLVPAIAEAVEWHAAVTHRIDEGRRQGRWIPTEAVDTLLARRPQRGLFQRVHAADLDMDFTPEELNAAGFLDADLSALVKDANEEIMASELVARRDFFDTIEKSPLTEEQARAVVCFDNRVQVLAAAGSGKTSVMVARAAYAVERGFVAPERVLLLAFNKAAATELQERIRDRFAAAGIDSAGVRASTFHAFGLDLIGRATGEKPRLASWLDQGEDVRLIMKIVDELRDASEDFRYRWDLYRTLFASAPVDLNENEPDGYDATTGDTGYRTFAGEVVKSHSERLIANFLYLNGIRYEYERPYNVDVGDATHSQYRPDFYYPDIDVWHEHWALDRDGNPPERFAGYAEAMAWKRTVHARHGSMLVESTWADVMFGDGLAKLRDKLSSLGLRFDWNPDRAISDERAKPIQHEDLARLVRTFMTHVKSNSFSSNDLDRRLQGDQSRLRGFRTRLFLDMYWQIHAEWQRRLDREGSVDFEDMLIRAAYHLERGDVECGYELIMVDELQDTSRARARLVRGLLRSPGRVLLAVGDDWQSINRFAGADLSVMTDFESWFGKGPRLTLTATFRCPQAICDAASGFVSKNPRQFKKPMRSMHRNLGFPIKVIRAEDAAGAVDSYLTDLSSAVSHGTAATGPSGKVTVDILGRYWFQRDLVPRRIPANLDVTFRTVHGAKGLEADYIVVPGMTTGTYGFPSRVADDPVLDLAMPEPEEFPHAEERRLLYVALTRARRQVTLITPSRLMSPFVVELLSAPDVTVVAGDDDPIEVCWCGRGIMVRRNGKFGPFLGCSTFPACRYTRPI